MIYGDSFISRGHRQVQVSNLGERQLRLVRGHPAFLSQKIKQEGNVLLAILEQGAADQEVIYVVYLGRDGR
jgi:hypothetical protein